MIALPLTLPLRLAIVGSPGYFKRREPPRSPDDLSEHACLRWRRSNGAIASWPLAQDGRNIEMSARGPLIARDFSTLLAAAIESVGLAQLPEPVAAEALRSGRLVSVLEPCARKMPGLFLYYPNRRQMAPKLRAFIDHAKAWRATAKGSQGNEGGTNGRDHALTEASEP